MSVTKPSTVKPIKPIQRSHAFNHLEEKHVDIVATKAQYGLNFVHKMNVLTELKARSPKAIGEKQVHAIDVMSDAEKNTLKDKMKHARVSRYNLLSAIQAFEQTVATKQTEALRAYSPAHEIVQEFILALNEELSSVKLDDSDASKTLVQLKLNLLEHCKMFVNGKTSLSAYRKECIQTCVDSNNKLPSVLTRAPKTFFEHIINALRVMFDGLNKTINCMSGKELFAKETPLAKSLTGRDRFFNRPTVNAGHSMDAFAEILNNLDAPAYDINRPVLPTIA